MIGICGCHRTGKTTLANALPSLISSDRYVVKEMKTEEMLKQLGVTAQSKMSLARRITIQRQLLKMYEKRLEELYREEEVEGVWASGSHEFNFVVDRTPIDVAAYLLVNASFQETTTIGQSQAEEIEKLLADSISVTSKYFDMVVHLPLGITVVEDSAKASCNPAFMIHLDLVIRGILQKHSHDNWHNPDAGRPFPVICWIDEDTTDLKERAVRVNDTFRNTFVENTAEDVLMVEQEEVPETKSKRKKKTEPSSEEMIEAPEAKESEVEIVPANDENS